MRDVNKAIADYEALDKSTGKYGLYTTDVLQVYERIRDTEAKLRKDGEIYTAIDALYDAISDALKAGYVFGLRAGKRRRTSNEARMKLENKARTKPEKYKTNKG